jgi:peroxiredoxin
MFRVRPVVVSVLLAVGLLAAGCGGEAPAGDPAPVPASDAPASTGASAPRAPADSSPAAIPETLAFTARTIDGDEFDGATLAGEPVAFWFWAAWCSRCAAAASDIKAVQAEYEGRVHLVGVAGLGSGDDGMRGFVDQHQLAGFPHLADDDGRVWQRFGVTTQEYFVLLDADGEIVHQGALRASALRDALAELAD